MKTFQELYTRAAARKGVEALEARLPSPSSDGELRATPDDRYLSLMAKRIFQAGFVWKVVENKWQGFEHAFRGFDVDWLATASEADHEALLHDRDIVRNGQKIRAVFENARFVKAFSAEHGGFGSFLADWPGDDIVGLWDVLAKRGARLGGATGPFFLRSAGKDTFLLSPDVVTCLIEQGIVAKKPTSKRALRAVQQAFNRWRDETGRPLCHISVVLACAVDS